MPQTCPYLRIHCHICCVLSLCSLLHLGDLLLLPLLQLFILPSACDDLHDVYREVYTLTPRWSDISFALYLPMSQEQTIRKESRVDDSVVY